VPLLLCDLDDTLLDRAAAFRAWAEGALGPRGVPGAVARAVELDSLGRVRRWDMIARLSVELRLGVPEAELLADYERDFIAAFGPHSLAPATAAALDRARAAGWTVGVLTNGDGLQVEKIRRSGLDSHLDGWCLTDEIGHQKPDPEAFRIAAAQLGSSLDGAWMIGDIETTDIAGAVAAGIPSVWIDNGRVWPVREFQPTLRASSAAEAIDLVLANPVIPVEEEGLSEK
jgi:putative hydrolase of the HAD superfamily